MANTERVRVAAGLVLSQMLLIGLLFTVAQTFGLIEAELFNAYLDHVLGVRAILITLMVVLSAIVGLISMIIFGIKSDNTRSVRFGRRRPYLLLGGVGAGVSMILFAFSGNYLTALIIDVVAVGIFSNAFYTAQRALIPDTVDVKHRGRANSLAVNLSILGYAIGIALYFILFEFFNDGSDKITQQGYILALSVGGVLFMVVGLMGFFWVKEPTLSDLPPKRPFRREFKEIFDMNELRKNKDFYKYVIAFTVFNSGNSVFLPFILIFISDLGLQTSDLLIILGMALPFLFGITYLLGRYTDKVGRKRIIPPTILIGCIGFFLVPIAAIMSKVSILFYGLIFTLIFVMLIAINTPLNAWHQDLLPEATRGKFLGILNITQTVSQVIGVTVGGLVATLAMENYAWVFPFAPIFYIVSIPIFLKVKETLPKLDKLSLAEKI
jgi:MFS family permease